jgi:hypothetical protein
LSAAFRAVPGGRALTPAERDLLSHLARALGSDVSDQVTECIVVGECHCGCSSIQLLTNATPLHEDETRRRSASERSDYLCVSSSGRSMARHEIYLGLHVVQGRLHELEIFDADVGEGAAVDLRTLTALTAPEVH